MYIAVQSLSPLYPHNCNCEHRHRNRGARGAWLPQILKLSHRNWIFAIQTHPVKPLWPPRPECLPTLLIVRIIDRDENKFLIAV